MMRAYHYQSDGTFRTGLNPNEIREALKNDEGLLWVDIEGPEDTEVEMLLEVFDLHPLTVEDCIMPNTRPKVEEFERYLFVVVQGLCRIDGAGLRTVELDVCLGNNFVLTLHSEPIRSVMEDCTRVEKRSPIITRGSDFLFYAIVDSLIDSYFPVLEEVEARVHDLEAKLLSDSSKKTIRQLFEVYNELVILRRTLTPHREILTRLNRAYVPFIKQANAAYFRDIYDHLLRMSDLVDSSREITMMLFEAQAMISTNRVNDIMRRMTALATLALPLVIVTGVYGMNFSEHPWMPQGVFHLLSFILVASVPVILVLFRRFRWL